MSSPVLTRRRFLKLGLAAASAPLLAGLYAVDVEPGWLTVTHTDIFIPNLPAAFDGYRIAHISDLHYDDGHYMPISRIRRVAALVNAQQPDVIVHTGDFVSEPHSWAYMAARYRGKRPGFMHSPNAEKVFGPCIAELTAIQAPDGALAVLGNHDHWVDADVARAHLVRSNIRLLENAHVVIRRGQEQLTIVGVDDLWTGEQALDRALANAPAPELAPRILLSHNPDYAAHPDVARYAISLMLSGHTHGGQVYVPGLGAPILPIEHKEFARGLVKTSWGQVFVSRGIGVITPPVRFLTRPEIAFLHLRRK